MHIFQNRVVAWILSGVMVAAAIVIGLTGLIHHIAS